MGLHRAMRGNTGCKGFTFLEKPMIRIKVFWGLDMVVSPLASPIIVSNPIVGVETIAHMGRAPQPLSRLHQPRLPDPPGMVGNS